MKTFKQIRSEAKQGHALVVGNKVVARGSKKQLAKQHKDDIKKAKEKMKQDKE